MLKLILVFAVALVGGNCQRVYSGGPSPRAEIPVPSGGGCRLAVAYPINPQQARLKAERGWQGLPFEAWRRIEIARLVAAKKAEYLNVPDYLICGDSVQGIYQLHGMDFWREKK